MNWLERTVDRLDRIEPRSLLLHNAGLALLFLIGEVSALWAIRAGTYDAPVGDEPYIYFGIALLVVALASALVAWFWQPWRTIVLKSHAALLLVGAVYTLWFSLSLVVKGIPGGTIAWNPLFFAYVVAYPVYLARRVFFLSNAPTPIVRYGHVLLAALALVISAGVFWRFFDWSPSEEDFRDDASSKGPTKIARVQEEPAVTELTGDGSLTEGVAILLSTSFEPSSGEDRTATRPFFQDGALPWGRDTRARSGQLAMNAIPKGNPGDLRYFHKSISRVLLSSRLNGNYTPFRVEGFRRVELEFWRLSISNPSTTHNCLGSLLVEYRLDAGEWQSKMAYCGWNKSKPAEWRRSLLEFDTAGHRELELRFDYEYPPDTQRDSSALYLVDDLVVRAYR